MKIMLKNIWTICILQCWNDVFVPILLADITIGIIIFDGDSVLKGLYNGEKESKYLD